MGFLSAFFAYLAIDEYSALIQLSVRSARLPITRRMKAKLKLTFSFSGS